MRYIDIIIAGIVSAGLICLLAWIHIKKFSFTVWVFYEQRSSYRKITVNKETLIAGIVSAGLICLLAWYLMQTTNFPIVGE